MTAAERNIGYKHMTDIPNSRRSPMEHERDMPNAAQPDAPNIARVAYDKYLASWGDEPSIAPHPRTSPGYTTGRVLIDIHNAADALDAAQAEIAKLRAALDRKAEAAETWRGKYSHVVCLHKPREDGTPPSDEEISSAIRCTEYKYFGDYEMSDDQRDAVGVLISAAQQLSAARAATNAKP